MKRLYSDSVYLDINSKGVLIDFCQYSSAEKAADTIEVISSIGMSVEYFEYLMKEWKNKLDSFKSSTHSVQLPIKEKK